MNKPIKLLEEEIKKLKNSIKYIEQYPYNHRKIEDVKQDIEEYENAINILKQLK